MKTKFVLYGLGAAAIGFLAWRYFKRDDQRYAVSPYAAPNQASQASSKVGYDPAMKYPFQPPVHPRVDNQDQPWSGSTRNLQVPQLSDISALQKSSADIKAGADVIGSLSSIWSDLGMSDMFASGGAGNVSTSDMSF